MLFFKTKPAQPEARPNAERRRGARHAIGPDFPLSCLATLYGAPQEKFPPAAKYKTRLINLSETGTRLRTGSASQSKIDGACELLFVLEDLKWTVRGQVVSVTPKSDDTVFGATYAVADETSRAVHAHVLDIIAMAATMKLDSAGKTPDESGYLTEHYACDRTARLTVWRQPDAKWVVGFELVTPNAVIRGANGIETQFLARSADGTLGAPTAAQLNESQRLFRWIIPNLSTAVPVDIRNFLRRAGGMSPLKL